MPEATFCVTTFRKDGSISYVYPDSENLARDAYRERSARAFTNPNVVRVTLRFIDSDGASETLEEWVPE